MTSETALSMVSFFLFGMLFLILIYTYGLIIRPWLLNWGTYPEERFLIFLGDDIVPDSRLTSTRGVTIKAPTSAIWGWLAQIGQQRGGFYSYEWLENRLGCQITNANQVVPLWELQVNDLVQLGPEGYPAFKVVEVRPNQALILQGFDINSGELQPVTWQFVLLPKPNGYVRLLVRFRMAVDHSLLDKLFWRIVMEPGQFFMEQKMLRSLKQRAEAHAPVLEQTAAPSLDA